MRRSYTEVPTASDIWRPRWAIATIFLVNGIGIGTWAASIPLIKERLQLNDATLAIVLVCASVGAIVAMPVCGALSDRYGSRRMTALGGSVFGCALAGAVAAPGLGVAAAAAFAMGAGNGTMDVAMNVNGVALQTRAQRPVMSSLHGLFSVGTFVAAAAMARSLALVGTPLAASFGGAALIVAASLLLRPLLVRDGPPAHTTPARRPWPVPRRLVLLGSAAICGAVSEGALVDWSGVYLRESLHTGITAALGGFAAYAVAMSVSRLGGDWIVRRAGPVALVRASGLLGAAGLAVALAVHTYPAVIAGFFIAGLGLGNVSPLVYGAGGGAADTGAGAGVAVVTTLGYSGFLIGPALIGFTAQTSSIDVAFALIAGFSIGIALLAPSVGSASPSGPAPGY